MEKSKRGKERKPRAGIETVGADIDTLSPIGPGHGGLLRSTVRVFYRALQRHLTEHGINVPQWLVLRALWDSDGLTQVELSKRLGIESAGVTAKLDVMEREGLVRRERNTEDRRKVNVFLAPRAMEIRAALIERAEAVNRLAERDIPQSDLEVMHRTLHKMIENLSEAEESTTGGR